MTGYGIKIEIDKSIGEITSILGVRFGYWTNWKVFVTAGFMCGQTGSVPGICYLDPDNVDQSECHWYVGCSPSITIISWDT